MTDVGEAAAGWAKSHPDASGLILVFADVLRGLGGRRGTVGRRYEYWVSAGKAAPHRTVQDPAGDGLARLLNGRCQVCGAVELKPVLRLGYAPDPEAEQVLTVSDSLRQVRRAALARVIACPGCYGAHSLAAKGSPYWTEKCTYHDRHHPVLAPYASSPPLAMLYADNAV